jgi:hypothetical protein
MIHDHNKLNRNFLLELIRLRYKIDGEPLTEQEAQSLLDRLDQEADYLGAYVDD